MNRQEIIDLKAQQLKEEVGLALSLESCKRIIESTINFYDVEGQPSK